MLIFDSLTIAGFVTAIAAALVFFLANGLPLHKHRPDSQ